MKYAKMILKPALFLCIPLVLYTCQGGVEDLQKGGGEESTVNLPPGVGMHTIDPGDFLDKREMYASFPCGTCDPACRTEGLIDPAVDGTRDGLGLNPDGPGVILGTELINAPYTWIAHYNFGQVSKINLADGSCCGVFRVGISGSNGDSPSRTTIDGKGNVYVANRGGNGWSNWGTNASVTKIAGDPNECIDKNSDGDNEDTSTDCVAAPLALGTDECVLWTRPFMGDYGARGIVVDFGNDVHWEGYPWIALTYSEKMYKLDPADGATMEEVDLDLESYGAAIDGHGWVWHTCWGCGHGAIQAVDTNPESTTYLQKTGLFYKPSGTCGTGWGYGITVDLRDRVWIGAWSDGGKPCRFTPQYDADGVPISGTWWAPPGITGRYRGIAVDQEGYIWTARWDSYGVWKFHADDGLDSQWIAMDCGPLGVGIDPFGRTWIANAYCKKVTKIEYNILTSSYDLVPYTTAQWNSYTYSDFTGVQRSLRNPRGIWEMTFERCDATPMDKWNDIVWDITTPSNSLVTIFTRSSDDLATIDSATDIVMAVIPPATPPKDIGSVFSDAGVYLGKYLKVRVVMEASADGQSPVFVDLYSTFNCY